jgi:hypothetical protein
MCSAVALPKHLLNVISSTHPAQGVKQHPSLDTFMLERNAISPSLTQQATAFELNMKLPTTETMAALISCSSQWCCASKSA